MQSARLIDGKSLAAAVRADVAARVAALVAAGRPAPGLVVVRVGEDPASEVYVRNKVRACQEAGLASRHLALPGDISGAELAATIRALDADPRVDGVLVQLPLPSHLDEGAILETVAPEKDVDGLTCANLGRLLEGRPRFVPCTPAGILALLEREEVEISGRHAVVVGRSEIVGKPTALLLLQRNATVTVCHSRTPDLGAETRRADILVSAVGRPGLITGEMVKPGAVVIDVGITRVGGKLFGDVAFESVARVASAVTPVPGGVGPMTVAMLLRNTLAAYQAGRGGG